MLKRKGDVFPGKTDKKKRKYDRILEELNRLRASITEENSGSEDSDNSEMEVGHPENTGGELENSEKEPGDDNTSELNDTTVQEYVALLGADPSACSEKAEDIHELVVRWDTYLKKGLAKDQKSELTGKYPLPENCALLRSPKLNVEVGVCINERASRQDKFMSSLQEQIGHTLAALAKPMNKILEEKQDDMKDTLASLADASQLLCNIHYSLTLHRKFNITPFLNYNCKKIMETCERDEFLLGKTFFEEVKSNQAILKSKNDLKANTAFRPPEKIVKQAQPIAGTSRSSNYLNSRRPATTARKRETFHYKNQGQNQRGKKFRTSSHR